MSDLREAAGRLRQLQRYGGQLLVGEVYLNGDEANDRSVALVTLDEMLVCDAILPELDETPVDEAWLKSVGCEPHEFSKTIHKLPCDKDGVYLSRPDGCQWQFSYYREVICEIVSRGQLRTLCRALGIQLGEGK